MSFLTTSPKIAPKWALPDALNADYTKAKTSIIPRIRTVLAPFSDAARELGTPNNFVKIAKNAAQYFVTLEASAPAKTLVGHCNTIGDSVKVFSVTKGVDDILSNASKTDATGIDLHQRNLGIASGFFQLVISGSAAAKLLNTFDVISLSGISEALGTTAVLPFSVFTSGIEIIKNGIDIANKSLKIHKSNLRSDKFKEKQKAFKNKTDSAKIGQFLSDHKLQMEAKQDAAHKKLAAQTELKNAEAAAGKALTEYNDAVQVIADLQNSNINVVSKFVQTQWLEVSKKNRKEAALFEAKESYDKERDILTKTEKKFVARVIKYDAFNKLLEQHQDAMDDKKDLLNQFIADKTARWKAIRENCSLENKKDGIGIALSVVATIGLIATIVLTFTGIGTIPVLLTMTSLWLILAIAGIGSTLYGKYNKPVAIPTVNFHKYAAAAA